MTNIPHTSLTNLCDESFDLYIDLDGPEGNAFWIIGQIVRWMRSADQGDMVPAFMAKATSASSYESLLKLCHCYAPVRFHRSGRPFRLYGN